MSVSLQDIPLCVLEYKWSSDVESNVYSDLETRGKKISPNYGKPKEKKKKKKQ